MNEVRVERMIQNYKECGELDSEDPALNCDAKTVASINTVQK